MEEWSYRKKKSAKNSYRLSSISEEMMLYDLPDRDDHVFKPFPEENPPVDEEQFHSLRSDEEISL